MPANNKQPDRAVAPAAPAPAPDAWAAPDTAQLVWADDVDGVPVQVRVDRTGAGLVVDVDYSGHHHILRITGATLTPTYTPPASPAVTLGRYGRTRPFRQPPPTETPPPAPPPAPRPTPPPAPAAPPPAMPVPASVVVACDHWPTALDHLRQRGLLSPARGAELQPVAAHLAPLVEQAHAAPAEGSIRVDGELLRTLAGWAVDISRARHAGADFSLEEQVADAEAMAWLAEHVPAAG